MDKPYTKTEFFCTLISLVVLYVFVVVLGYLAMTAFGIGGFFVSLIGGCALACVLANTILR